MVTLFIQLSFSFRESNAIFAVFFFLTAITARELHMFSGSSSSFLFCPSFWKQFLFFSNPLLSVYSYRSRFLLSRLNIWFQGNFYITSIIFLLFWKSSESFVNTWFSLPFTNWSFVSNAAFLLGPTSNFGTSNQFKRFSGVKIEQFDIFTINCFSMRPNFTFKVFRL